MVIVKNIETDRTIENLNDIILKVDHLIGCYKGTFGKVYAVDNVSLTIKEGEIVGIAGESGSGKSTFAELISGVPRPLLHYESGLIDIKGYDIYHIDKELLRSEVLSQIIGYVPQASMNSLNPVIKVKHFILDVMKQRTSQMYGNARKSRLVNLIFLRGLEKCSLLSLSEEKIQKISIKLSSLFKKKPYALLTLQKLAKKIINFEQTKQVGSLSEIIIPNQIQKLASLRNEKGQDLTLKNVNKYVFKTLTIEDIEIIFRFSLQSLEVIEIKKNILDILSLLHSSSNYKQLIPVFEEILRKIYEFRDILNINPNWWDVLWKIQVISTDKQVLAQAILHFERLGLNKKVLDLYPHELSGGMKQRTAIAISTLWNPKLLIVDEPTSALDVSTQKRLLDLFLYLKEQKIVETILFISHDIPTLRQVCTRCIIMYGGHLVEDADMDTIIDAPKHPYTQSLVKAIVSFNPDGSPEGKLERIDGKPPDLREPPTGCRFHPRCSKAMDICKREIPPIFTPDLKDPNHQVKCWLFASENTENEELK